VSAFGTFVSSLFVACGTTRAAGCCTTKPKNTGILDKRGLQASATIHRSSFKPMEGSKNKLQGFRAPVGRSNRNSRWASSDSFGTDSFYDSEEADQTSRPVNRTNRTKNGGLKKENMIMDDSYEPISEISSSDGGNSADKMSEDDSEDSEMERER